MKSIEKMYKKLKINEYMGLLAGNTISKVQDFRINLRTEVDLIEDDIRLVLDEYNLNFITYEKLHINYTFKDLSEVLSRNLQSEYEGVNNTVDLDFDDISMKGIWL